MNARIRILLALLGCLVFGANALGAVPGHCDPLCCAEPCESGPLAPPTDCACCAVRGDLASDPLLPSLIPAAPQPALLTLPADLPATAVSANFDGVPAVPGLAPPVARPTILRL